MLEKFEPEPKYKTLRWALRNSEKAGIIMAGTMAIVGLFALVMWSPPDSPPMHAMAASHLPLVEVNGHQQQLPAGDSLSIPGGVSGPGTFTGLITGNASEHLDTSTSDGSAPELDWIGRNGDWFDGVDVANTTPARDFVMVGRRGSYSFEDGVCNGTTTLTSAAQGGFSSVLVGKTIAGTNIAGGTTVTAVASATSLTLSNTCTTGTGLRFTVTDPNTYDVAYWKHRGSLVPTLGLGITPPDGSYRLQVTGSDTEATVGGIGIRIAPGSTADGLNVHDSTPNTLFDVKANGHIGAGGGTVIDDDSFTCSGTSTLTGRVGVGTAPNGTDSLNVLNTMDVTDGSTAELRFGAGGAANYIESGTSGTGGTAAILRFTNMNAGAIWGQFETTGSLTLNNGLTSTAGTTNLGVTNTGNLTAGSSTSNTHTIKGSVVQDGPVNGGAGAAPFYLLSGATSGIAGFSSGVMETLDAQAGTADYINFTAASAKGLMFSNASSASDGYVLYDLVARTLTLHAGSTDVEAITSTGDSITGTLTVSGNITASSTTNAGSITLSGGTGTATVRSGSHCVCTDTTANVSVKCAVSSTTLTATGTSSDVIAYLCF